MPVHREAPPAPANRTQKRANGSVLLAHELAEDARGGNLLALGQHLVRVRVRVGVRVRVRVTVRIRVRVRARG